MANNLSLKLLLFRESLRLVFLPGGTLGLRDGSCDGITCQLLSTNKLPETKKKGKSHKGRLMTRTFNALDLVSSEAGKCPLVLGPADTCRANGASKMMNWSASRRSALTGCCWVRHCSVSMYLLVRNGCCAPWADIVRALITGWVGSQTTYPTRFSMINSRNQGMSWSIKMQGCG
jgi:hypothetical protein